MTGRHPDPMISPAALHARLAAPDLRILDASWHLPTSGRDGRGEYAAGRIPGAVFFDIDDLSDATSPLPHMLAPPEKFSSRMRRLGVGDGAQIVVYDSLGVFSAARAWWMLRAMSHEDVFVLDGGLPAWTAAGFDIEDDPPMKRGERHFSARLRSDLVRNLGDMRRIVDAGAAQVLDARPPGRFAGRDPEPRPGLRGGHMPGAINLPYTSLLTVEGRLKPSAELEAAFAAAGADPKAASVATCGSGVSAAVIALALARLGRWHTPIYDGSWAEWGGRDDTPVATA
jgi:thiosulfate/3-mercaptopyruvate sulfurtransferase